MIRPDSLPQLLFVITILSLACAVLLKLSWWLLTAVLRLVRYILQNWVARVLAQLADGINFKVRVEQTRDFIKCEVSFKLPRLT